MLRYRKLGLIGNYPGNTVAPVVSGSLGVGNVLTTTNGTWTNTPTSFHYQWYNVIGGVSTPVGTDANTYTQASGDIGDNIYCVVQAVNAAGSGFAFSNQVGPVTGSLSAGTLAFDVANGWVTGQDPPALVITLPSNGSIQVNDWYRIVYGTSPTLTGATDGPWYQITSTDILSGGTGTTSYPWGTSPPPGLTYFGMQFGRGANALSITSTSPLSNIINDTLAAWVPSALYQSGEWGYVFDPSSTANFWQDSAGTVAGAFGSPIGKLIDVYSGGNHHFTQGTTAKQPGAASPGWMSFDGTDDLLAFAGQGLFAGVNGCSIVMAVEGAARASVSFLWLEESTSSNNPVYQPGTRCDNTLGTSQPIVFERTDTGSQNTDSVAGIALYDGNPHVLSLVDTVALGAGSVNSWVDRVAGTNVNYTRGTLTLNNTSLGAGQRTSEGNWWPGSVGRAIFINRPLTSAERAAAEAWCAAPYGISLP